MEVRSHRRAPSRPPPFGDLIIAQDNRPGLDKACHTLQNAASFLGSGLGGRWGILIDGPHRGKVLGNGLRELDRFLNVLLGEVAHLCFAEHERDRLERLRNTALKFGAICAQLARPAPELSRLLAIGRCRDCLFHCNGIVRRADERGGTSMVTGWPAYGNVGPGRSIMLGARLAVTAEDVAWVCAFYHAIATDLKKCLSGQEPSARNDDRRTIGISL